jgi:preprotein translocase subunit SecY
MGLLGIVKNAFKEPTLRKKIFMTLLLIVIFRIGCFIPVPGIDPDALYGLAQMGMFQFMDLISGGALEQASLFAMGISPYINASIIIQLLTVAIPALERLQKEGPEGRKKISQITKYTAIGLAIFQSIMLFINMNNSGDVISDGLSSAKWLACLFVVFSFTAGTAILTWLGDKITEVGIGNGISVIIFAGIVARAPEAVKTIWNLLFTQDIVKKLYARIPLAIAIILVFLAVVVAVVWMEGGERRLGVQYSQRVVGRKLMGGQKSYIPLKVNASGVLPIIFAMSLLQFPLTIASFIDQNSKVAKSLTEFNGTWWYLILYAVLIVAFTFFYNMVYFDPKEYANNLINNGGQILELRTTNRKATAEYIGKVSQRITWFGSIFLAVLATLPGILGKICDLIPGLESVANMNLWFGGTSVIILVGVALETIRQLEAQLLMRHYKSGKGGFLS